MTATHGSAAPTATRPARGYVRRFSRTERVLHWANALGFFVLLGSGLILYLPSLAVLVGRRPLIKDIHFWSGIGWVTVLAVIVLLGDRRGLLRTARELDAFDGDDLRWLRGKRAPQGRFNAGQKINATLTAAFTILFLVSGLLLWLGERDTRFRFASTVVLHDGLDVRLRDPARRPPLPRADLSGDPARAPWNDARNRRRAVGGATSLEVEATMSSMTTVLVVDDEPIVRDVVVRYLRRDGFTTLEAGDGDSARRLIETGEPELVVLDVMLPGTDGLELCRWIRSRSALPVIMLTARGEEADRIVGLELGADDYVTKPFSPRELATRVRTVLRRSGGVQTQPERLAFADVVLDGASREVTKAGTPMTLTAREFDLLWFLASHPRQVFSRDQLMDRVWGHAVAIDTGTVTVHIRRLREKIEIDPARPVASPDRLGRRLPLRPVIGLALAVAAASLAVGLLVALALRAAPTVWLQLAGLAFLSVCVPLAAVLLSGWVMFHMGADVKILAVAAGSASAAVIAGPRPRPVDRRLDQPRRRLGAASRRR